MRNEKQGILKRDNRLEKKGPEKRIKWVVQRSTFSLALLENRCKEENAGDEAKGRGQLLGEPECHVRVLNFILEFRWEIHCRFQTE